MVVVIFRSHVRADADMAEMEAMGARMHELASAMPGFIEYREYAGQGDEYLTLVTFEDEATLLAWRHEREHAQGQQSGRDRFFEDYHIQVCTPIREYAFDRTQGRHVIL